MKPILLLVVHFSRKRTWLPSSQNETNHTELPHSSYLITDYERQNFTISQAILQPSYQQQIIAIPPLDEPKPVYEPPNSFPKGAIAGIVIGGVLIILGIALIFWLKRRKRKRAKAEALTTQPPPPPTSPTFEKTEMSSDQIPIGFQQPSERVELAGTPLRQPFEMQGQGDPQEVFELESPVEARFPSGVSPVETRYPSGMSPVSPVQARFSSGVSPVETRFSEAISPVEAGFPSGVR